MAKKICKDGTAVVRNYRNAKPVVQPGEAHATAMQIATCLERADWDQAHQIVTDFRRQADNVSPQLAELDPYLVRILIAAEQEDWGRCHRVLLDMQRVFLPAARPARSSDVWQWPVYEMAIDTRVLNLFDAEGIDTFGQVLSRSRGALFALPNFGEKYLAQVAFAIDVMRDLLLAEADGDRFREQVHPDWQHWIRHGEWPAAATVK